MRCLIHHDTALTRNVASIRRVLGALFFNEPRLYRNLVYGRQEFDEYITKR